MLVCMEWYAFVQVIYTERRPLCKAAGRVYNRQPEENDNAATSKWMSFAFF